MKEVKRCKKVVYFQNENGPHFSIRKGSPYQSHGLMGQNVLLSKEET